MNKLFLQALLLASLSAQPLLANAQESGLQWRLSGYDIYYRLPGELTWQHAPGSALELGDGWVIGTDQTDGGYAIYRWNGYDWDREPGGAVEIGGTYFHPWVINDRGEFFNWNGSDWRLGSYDDRREERVYIDRAAPVQIYEGRTYIDRSPPVVIHENHVHIDRPFPGQLHENHDHIDRPFTEERHDGHADHDHDADRRFDARLNFNSNNPRPETYSHSRDEHSHIDRTPAVPAAVPTRPPAVAPVHSFVPAPAPARPFVPAPAPAAARPPAPAAVAPPAPVQKHEDAHGHNNGHDDR